MITLQHLKWSNCFSYGPDNELNLDERTVTQILGTNGMGKSSIPLIIEEALYNKNSKGIKKADIPNRYINDGYSIGLEFSRDNDAYEVTVTRKSSVKVKLTKNGEDISSHTATNTYKTIQEIIGLDFKTFSQLVYQNTNASLQFLTATDTNRKKFLIELLELEKYVELFDLFKTASKQVSLEIASVASKVSTIEKWLNDNRLEDTSILPMVEETIHTEVDEKLSAELSSEIKNISEKNKKISKNNTYKKLLKDLDAEKARLEGSAGTKSSYDAEQSEVGSLRQVVSSAKKFIDKMTDLEGTCPTCEQPVDEDLRDQMLESERSRGSEAACRIKELQTRIEQIKQQNSEAELYDKVEREWREAYRSLDQELPSSLLEKDTLEAELAAINSRLTEARQKISKISSENQRRTKHNTRIQVILEQTEEFTKQLKECNDILSAVKELSSNLEVLKKSFSTNGLIAYKIENLVKELEELTNSYLGELSDGRFTLEFVVSNDKLNVEITDNGNTVDILALSSGELARVNTATLIAIRKLMSSISKSRINVLFLDEVINVLDDTGREKIVEVLLNEDLHTYIVSHGWSHPLLDKVEVIKCNNVSKLEY